MDSRFRGNDGSRTQTSRFCKLNSLILADGRTQIAAWHATHIRDGWQSRRVQAAKTSVREHDRRAEKRRREERERGAAVHASYAASVYELLPSPMYDSYTCSNSALHFVCST